MKLAFIFFYLFSFCVLFIDSDLLAQRPIAGQIPSNEAEGILPPLSDAVRDKKKNPRRVCCVYRVPDSNTVAIVKYLKSKETYRSHTVWTAHGDGNSNREVTQGSTDNVDTRYSCDFKNISASLAGQTWESLESGAADQLFNPENLDFKRLRLFYEIPGQELEYRSVGNRKVPAFHRLNLFHGKTANEEKLRMCNSALSSIDWPWQTDGTTHYYCIHQPKRNFDTESIKKLKEWDSQKFKVTCNDRELEVIDAFWKNSVDDTVPIMVTKHLIGEKEELKCPQISDNDIANIYRQRGAVDLKSLIDDSSVVKIKFNTCKVGKYHGGNHQLFRVYQEGVAKPSAPLASFERKTEAIYSSRGMSQRKFKLYELEELISLGADNKFIKCELKRVASSQIELYTDEILGVPLNEKKIETWEHYCLEGEQQFRYRKPAQKPYPFEIDRDEKTRKTHRNRVYCTYRGREIDYRYFLKARARYERDGQLFVKYIDGDIEKIASNPYIAYLLTHLKKLELSEKEEDNQKRKQFYQEHLCLKSGDNIQQKVKKCFEQSHSVDSDDYKHPLIKVLNSSQLSLYIENLKKERRRRNSGCSSFSTDNLQTDLLFQVIESSENEGFCLSIQPCRPNAGGGTDGGSSLDLPSASGT
jgi:hypothetical protein